MKFLGWYSFVIVVICIGVWLPDIFANTADVDTGLKMLMFGTPIAVYLFMKAKEEM